MAGPQNRWVARPTSRPAVIQVTAVHPGLPTWPVIRPALLPRQPINAYAGRGHES